MTKLTPDEVAARFGVTTKTLAMWRWKGVGPEYQKPSPARVFYTVEAIERYEREMTFRSCSDEKCNRADAAERARTPAPRKARHAGEAQHERA